MEQNRHIPKVSVLQRRQSASSVGRKGTTVPFADQKVKMHVSMLQVQSSPAPECVDCVLDEYKPVYFYVPIRHLKTVRLESLDHPKLEPHINPLWLSQESSSQIFQIDCEVDTGASCNIFRLYKAKALFREDSKLGKPTVNLNG